MSARLQALQRTVEICESARQWRKPTWYRIEKEMRLWCRRRRRQQHRLELTNLRKKAVHDRKRLYRKKRKRRKGSFKNSRFWRHLQSQVNSDYFAETRRRAAGQSWQDDRSTRAQLSPFQSDSERPAGSVSTTKTDSLRSLSTSAPSNRKNALMAHAQRKEAQPVGRTVERSELPASSSTSHTDKPGPTMTASSQGKRPSSISSLSEEAHLNENEITTTRSSKQAR